MGAGADGRSPDLSADWTPLLPVGKFGARVGLTSSGRWVIGTENRVIELEPNGNCYVSLPVLECQPEEFLNDLGQRLSAFGFPADIVLSFPSREMIRYALSRGDYWASRALDWVEGLGIVEHDGDLGDALERLAANKRLGTQATRQRARRVLKRWGKHAAGRQAA